MRLPHLLALAIAAALAAAGCSTSPCQRLGEKLCGCTGLTGETCTTQVEQQLNSIDPSQATLDRCDALLARCHEPSGASFCEWLTTPDGKIACGLSPDVVTTTVTATP